ncbi:MAG: glycosyltransferase [Actinomycetota bacterium]
MPEIPDEIRRLAAERDERRKVKDFEGADALRERIAQLGYRVTDGPQGAEIEPVAVDAPHTERLSPDRIESVLEDAPTADVSVHWVVEGWPEDVVRALTAFKANAGSRTVQYVVVDLTETRPGAYGDDVEVLALGRGTGWAAARNAGITRSRGRVVLVVDGSVEPQGDVFGPIEAALADPSVGVCGPFGISTRDLREFHESDGVGEIREVDAVEGYLMAFRRDVLRDVGLFDDKFRWYRTADIELSFRLKEAGFRARVIDLPVAKHVHRMWAETPPPERDRLSKRNYYRFLERFRDRFDLLVEPDPPRP